MISTTTPAFTVLYFFTPQVFVSDISVIPDLSSDNTNGTLKFKAVIISPEKYRASLVMTYELYDRDGKVVATVKGPGLMAVS